MLATSPSLVTANNTFGFRLLQRLCTNQPDENVLISPASIALALSMVGNGAGVAASRNLRWVLRLPDMEWPVINAAHADLWQDLQIGDPQVVLETANSLWADPCLPFAAPFRFAVEQFFGAEVGNVDFADLETAVKILNAWTAAKTHGKIPALLQSADLLHAVLVLINAIYFKGLWTHPFPRERTQQGEFHLADGKKLQLPLMRRTGQFHYAEYQQWQMISLPFGNGRLSLIIVLPQPGITLRQLQTSLNADTWSAWLDRLQLPQPGVYQTWERQMINFGLRPGTLLLPRFKLKYRTNLMPHLGLAADTFPHVTTPPDPDLHISKILHESVLEVDEAGAEAAAATAVIVAKGLPWPPFHMLVNRPFLCALRDNLSGLLLFMGAVHKPDV